MFRAQPPEQHLDGDLLAPANRDLERLRAINARLEATLAKVFEEVREFPDAAPESTDSYLPPHLVVEIAETLLDAGAVIRPDSHRTLIDALVIYSPQGCGKTKHAASLAKHFGMQRIVDDWNGSTPLQDGTLALTSICPSEVRLYADFTAGRYEVYPFDLALVALDGFLDSAADDDRRPE